MPPMLPRLRIAMFSSWAMNPYQDLLVQGLDACGVDVDALPLARLASFAPRPDHAAIHVHAMPFRIARDRASLRRAVAVARRIAGLRRAGLRVVWTPHDFRSHRDLPPRGARLDRLARRAMARLANVVHVHSEFERSLWESAGVAPRKLVLAPHGHYIGWHPDAMPRTAAREALGLREGELVFLFFGWLRRNKGLLELLSAFSHFDDETARLVVAGAPEDAALADAALGFAARDARIRVHAAAVASDAVQVYLNAADVVALPYRATIATSGAALLAASFGKACIAPRTANFGAALDAATNFALDAVDPQSILDALRRVSKQRDTLAARGAENRRRVQRWDWVGTAEILRAHYLRSA
jgi:glycosyltransferase involved in cell wall biosynthesis